MARLGEIALKLERYRYLVASALAWVIFGMIFGAMITLGNSLALLGVGYEIFWILLMVAGLSGGYVYHRFWKYAPKEGEVERRWRWGVLLLILPFVISYSLIPLAFEVSAFYFGTVWYPSLGLGLLLNGFYVWRRRNVMIYAGISILLTSLIILPLSTLPMNVETVTASNLLCVSMTMIIYFVTAIYIFFRAERICLTKT